MNKHCPATEQAPTKKAGTNLSRSVAARAHDYGKDRQATAKNADMATDGFVKDFIAFYKIVS